MILDSFVDELTRQPACRQSLVKVARASKGLTGRLAATGALSAGAYHAGAKTKSALFSDPNRPEGTLGAAAGKGAIGGLLAAALLKVLAKMGRR